MEGFKGRKREKGGWEATAESMEHIQGSYCTFIPGKYFAMQKKTEREKDYIADNRSYKWQIIFVLIAFLQRCSGSNLCVQG